MTATTWTNQTITSTSYQGREVVDKGATMDDAVYTMDSALINMDDMKLQSIYAPATTWTNQ